MGRQEAGCYGRGLEVATLLQDRLQVGDSLHQLVCPSGCPHLDVHLGSLTEIDPLPSAGLKCLLPRVEFDQQSLARPVGIRIRGENPCQFPGTHEVPKLITAQSREPMSPSRDADSRRGEICRWFEGSARRLGSLEHAAVAVSDVRPDVRLAFLRPSPWKEDGSSRSSRIFDLDRQNPAACVDHSSTRVIDGARYRR